MANAAEDAETAIELAREYADEECLGELGDVLDATEDGGLWVVRFLTHALAATYEHQVRVTSTGIVVGHERTVHDS